MIAPNELTQQSPYYLRLTAFFNERFPPWQIVVLFPLYLASLLVGKVVAEQPMSFGWRDVMGFIAFLAFYLMLRIMDEHKDIEHDNEHYPRRVLQRGLVTLPQLRRIGIGCVLVATGVSLAVDGGFGRVTTWWLALFALSLLMLRYFFIRSYLDARRVILTLTHAPATPLATVWAAQIGANGRALDVEAAWLPVMALVSTFMVEVGRKSRAPEDMRTTVVDYTKPSRWTHSFGLHGAVLVLVVLSLLTALFGAVLLHQIGHGSWGGDVALGLTTTGVLAAAVRFATTPDRFTAKHVASWAIAATFAVQVVLATALLLTA